MIATGATYLISNSHNEKIFLPNVDPVVISFHNSLRGNLYAAKIEMSNAPIGIKMFETR